MEKGIIVQLHADFEPSDHFLDVRKKVERRLLSEQKRLITKAESLGQPPKNKKKIK